MTEQPATRVSEHERKERERLRRRRIEDILNGLAMVLLIIIGFTVLAFNFCCAKMRMDD